MRRAIGNPFAPVVLYSLGASLIFAVYAAEGTRPSSLAQEVFGLGWVLILLMWIETDARCRREVPCYDFPFLIGAVFTLGLPWYCVWSRRARGLLLLLAVYGLMSLPNLVVEFSRR